jgi:hypothetical protein
VQRDDRLRLEVAEHAVLEHLRGTEDLPDFGRTFLRWLEHEHHLARERLAPCRDLLRDPHQDRDVRVVATGVHHTHGLAAVRGRLGRSERQAGGLGHRQRVHVGAQRDARAGLRAFDYAGDAGAGDTGTHLHAERAQVRRDELRRARLAMTELGMPMQVASPFDHLRVERIGSGLGFRGGNERRHEHHQQHQHTHHDSPCRSGESRDVAHHPRTDPGFSIDNRLPPTTLTRTSRFLTTAGLSWT